MLRYAISGDTYTLGTATRLARDGVDFFQLRAETLPAGELLNVARTILDEISSVPHAPTRLLINSRADIAVAAGAHGVHLTSRPGELTPAQVRSVFAPSRPGILGAPSSAAASSPPKVGCTVSTSCHTLDEIYRAHTLGTDLILFGPVFEKRVANLHITDGSGLALLHEAVLAAQGTPVLALGGITHKNTADCLAAGAAGIAAIRLFA